MTLDELIQPQEAVLSSETAAIQVTNIQYHSGACSGSSLFFALSGSQTDGNIFVTEAVEKGAVAVVTEKDDLEAQVPVIHVSDARKILARTADRFYGHPQNNLRLIGVTGTNGKTTVCHLVCAIYQKAGIPCGMIGTIHHYIADSFIPNTGITTPESLDVHRYFSEMIDAGKQACVMEVSSHSLVLDRVYGIEFDTAVFTNLSRDHLDFHESYEKYLAAKMLLFKALMPENDAVGVIYYNDPAFSLVREVCRVKCLTFGTSGSPDIRLVKSTMDSMNSRIILETPAGKMDILVRLPGEFNILNAMATVGVGIAENISPDDICTGIEAVERVPGRFERIQCGQDFDVFVDYAHTPDALRKVLSSAKSLTQGRLISVFGCGGDRDKGKRSVMGRISAEIADFTVITSDNPRTEIPDAIVQDILNGIDGENGFRSIVDRREAIRYALKIAMSNDLVLICGKGHEAYQILGAEKIPFDDSEEVRRFFKH